MKSRGPILRAIPELDIGGSIVRLINVLLNLSPYETRGIYSE